VFYSTVHKEYTWQKRQFGTYISYTTFIQHERARKKDAQRSLCAQRVNRGVLGTSNRWTT